MARHVFVVGRIGQTEILPEVELREVNLLVHYPGKRHVLHVRRLLPNLSKMTPGMVRNAVGWTLLAITAEINRKKEETP